MLLPSAAVPALAPAIQEAGKTWTAGDWITLAVIAAVFLFLGLGAWRLRRIKKQGLEGHAHRFLDLDGWRLAWPDWWPEPERVEEGWMAGPLDHDGHLALVPIGSDQAALAPGDFLRTFLERRGFRLDEWDPEEWAGAHGTIHLVESRADAGAGLRAYLWLARIPGTTAEDALALLYRSSVLYGLADGFWLNEVAVRAQRA
jgi:hypothetical protein